MAKRKYKRLHYEDRQTIEAMSKQGSSVSDIAEALGTHRDAGEFRPPAHYRGQSRGLSRVSGSVQTVCRP